MLSKTRIAVAAAAGATILATTSGAALAAPRLVQPQTVTTPVIEGGADGKPHLLLCPPDENVFSGGYLVTPGAGRMLDREPADVLESRANEDATGWIIAVRKNDAPTRGGESSPANLTIRIVCTQGENTPTPSG
ncbi:hypothetical protein [Kitasatospora kifunensis]|uniref:Secreted protein n=1 Tax=Kitasatospora kifunensis TaxID=58351 RepID=A0A7W7R8Z6_KITKI|nr:hypothetical protein [Kitasatospora kifunensis]MBB4927514.1 hypothetical protein [Kitasatospora kifunensis]